MRLLAGLSLLSALSLAACSDATGSLVGGDVTLASSTTGGDGGSTTGDGGLTYLTSLSPACQPGAANGGNRWQDLFACYFGSTGVASCSLTSACHGTSTNPGAMSSNYVCATDSTACYTSMTSVAANLVTPGTPAAQTTLYAVLRKTDGTGTMPQAPITLVFQSGDMARIAAWITAGAKND
jgi:hypothetical protein